MAEEFVHRCHNVGMGVERATGEADVGRAIVAEALHVLVVSADDADGKSAAHRFPIGHEVGLDAEIFLGAAQRQAEAHEDLVEDQHDVALAADRAQLLQPRGIGFAADAGVWPAVNQSRIGRRTMVGVEGLRRIDEHAGDVAAGAQHLEGGFRHVGQRVGFVRRQRIADAGLHVAPPAVIGAAQAHEPRAPRVVAGEPHGLHHRFGARHVERDLVFAGNADKARDIVGDQRRIGAQHRPERADARGAAVHARLVEVVAEKVHAVGTRQVVAGIAVEVGDLDAFGRGEERAHRKACLGQPAELERHAVALGELQVGDVPGGFRGLLQRPLVSRAEQAREAVEFGAPPARDLGRGIVGAKEMRIVEGVVGHQGGDAARQARVAAQRAMLRARDGEPGAGFHGQQDEQRYGEDETESGGNAQVHGHRFSLASLVLK